MKYLITTAIVILLSACAPIQYERVTESTRITVHVLSQGDLDIKCERPIRGCTIDHRQIYVRGAAQNVTMLLSPEYVNALPADIGFAGDALAEKLGLELSFNDRETLGHEFMVHVLGEGRDAPRSAGYF